MEEKIFNQETFAELRDAICKVMANLDPCEVTEWSDLRNDLGMDSLDIYEASLKFEKSTKRYYPVDMETNDKILQCRTVADLVGLYESIAAKPSSATENGRSPKLHG